MENTQHSDVVFCFKRYFQFFFLFGQNTSQPNKNVPSKRIFSYMPTIFAMIFIIFCEQRLLLKVFGRIGRENKIMLHTMMMVNMLPGLISTIESFRIQKGTKKFVQIFNMVTERLKYCTSAKIVWKNVENQMRRKIIIIIVWCIFSVFFRLMWRSPLYGRRYEIWSLFLMFYRTASVFHIIFYVDLVKLLIASVSCSVEAQRQILRKKVFLDLKKVINIMKLAKLQHLQIWDCCQVINQYFPIIAITILIDSMYTMTIYGYFTFYFWRNDENLVVTMRKYFL